MTLLITYLLLTKKTFSIYLINTNKFQSGNLFNGFGTTPMGPFEFSMPEAPTFTMPPFPTVTFPPFPTFSFGGTMPPLTGTFRPFTNTFPTFGTFPPFTGGAFTTFPTMTPFRFSRPAGVTLI